MKKGSIIYHFLFWLLAYIFWIFVFRNSTLVLTHAITIQFCYLLFIAANYYFNTLYNIPQLLDKKQYAKFGCLFILTIAITALVRIPVSMLVTIYVFKVAGAHFNYLTIFYDSFVNILFWVALILGGKMIGEKIRSEIYIEKIEKEKAANELNFLRAQFNPHFLFNSINSIYGHIDKSNKPAREMLLSFSEMLRYQLYECNVAQIEIDRELNYMKNYIDLQKSRIDERIKVSFCDGQIGSNLKIAPLLLITFIENAFKYVGFNEGRDNYIDISLTHNNGKLVFKAANSKDACISRGEKSSGLGVANAKRLLELLYPDKHLLHINDQEESYEITLTLFDV
ncbi:histidine kinase [Mucilaginibacter sabulilitoris]|uniref:Histidine kinase n=1 Tax=Mucilaginibacter sabulilitoris TaxID=1173583 RepID=A0ABZ0TVZ5_9SPHI|nr:histidine kinase [Mucilaginibacter sabulilitoris]WPU97047.1 histidine kinase [Mucilaginibacter sabulilitoris]